MPGFQTDTKYKYHDFFIYWAQRDFFIISHTIILRYIILNHKT